MHKTLFRSENTRFVYVESYEGSGWFYLKVVNARIFAKNFSGRSSKFGTKSFCVDIPEEIKDRLINDGWDVHISTPRKEDDDPGYFIPVTIKFRKSDPIIVKTEPNTPVEYDEDTVGELDEASISAIELLLNNSHGKTKNTAYLREMRFKQPLSPLDYDEDDDPEYY